MTNRNPETSRAGRWLFDKKVTYGGGSGFDDGGGRRRRGGSGLVSDVDGYVQGGRENFRFRVNLKFITNFPCTLRNRKWKFVRNFREIQKKFHKVGNMIDFNLLFKMFMLCI